jgi:hypothetical protein
LYKKRCILSYFIGVKPLIHQSELRTYTKVVPFKEKKYHTVGIVSISNKNNSRNRNKIGIPTTHIKAFKLSNILRVVEFFVLVTRPPSSGDDRAIFRVGVFHSLARL